MAYLAGQFHLLTDDEERKQELLDLYDEIEERNRQALIEEDKDDDVNVSALLLRSLEEESVDMDLMSPEFYDFLQVLEYGALKHGQVGDVANWESVNGAKSSHKDMHASMFRHLAESSAHMREDHESGLDPLLHLASRALMMYTRIQRGLIHEEDIL